MQRRQQNEAFRRLKRTASCTNCSIRDRRSLSFSHSSSPAWLCSQFTPGLAYSRPRASGWAAWRSHQRSAMEQVLGAEPYPRSSTFSGRQRCLACMGRVGRPMKRPLPACSEPWSHLAPNAKTGRHFLNSVHEDGRSTEYYRELMTSTNVMALAPVCLLTLLAGTLSMPCDELDPVAAAHCRYGPQRRPKAANKHMTAANSIDCML